MPTTPTLYLPTEIWIMVLRWALNIPWLVGISSLDDFERPLSDTDTTFISETIVKPALERKKTLRLVCKLWNEFVDEIGHEHVEIFDYDALRAFSRWVAGHSKLQGNFTKSIRIAMEPNLNILDNLFAKRVTSLFDACKNLRNLSVCVKSTEAMTKLLSSPLFDNCATSLRYLEWRNVDFTLIPLLSQLPRSSHLEYLSLRLNDPDRYEDLPDLRLPKLHSLRLHGSTSLFLSWMSRWDVPSLSKFSIRTEGKKNQTSWSIGVGVGFFQKNGDTIRFLSFEPEAPSDLPIIIESCHNLQHLALSVRAFPSASVSGSSPTQLLGPTILSHACITHLALRITSPPQVRLAFQQILGPSTSDAHTGEQVQTLKVIRVLGIKIFMKFYSDTEWWKPWIEMCREAGIRLEDDSGSLVEDFQVPTDAGRSLEQRRRRRVSVTKQVVNQMRAGL
jgi:hypothetical protein